MIKRYRNSGMVISLVFPVLAIVASGLGGCAAPGPAGTVVKADVVQSYRPRLPAESPEEAGVPELVAGNTAFALELYRELFDSEQNLFFSPYSLSTALAMSYAGAREETEQQMAEALHYSLPQAELHPAFNALDQALANDGAEDDEEAFRLHGVNALWGDQHTPFLDAFLDTLAENYGAELRVADFRQAEETRLLINEWVSEQTRRKIQDLLPPGSVDGETALILTNAIYFKAAWMHPFAEDLTHDGTFHLLDGGQVMVPMMEQVENLSYGELPGVQAVELPYADDARPGAFSMVVVLPEAGAFEAFARELDAEKLDAIVGSLEPMPLRLIMPRFGFDAELKLKEALMALGVVDAFGAADFSGIDGTQELFIDEVYHQALVSVDEAGTEAGASTAVVMARKGGLHPEQEVKIDRPFLFVVRGVETGTILFLGQVVNPAA